MTDPPVTYAAAGVDIDAGDRAVALMKASVARAGRPEVLGGLGGFAGLFRLDTTRYRRPLLASSTDGVGTKIAVARALRRYDTVGIDLVAMVVDDLVVCGAEPLFLQDYIACGKVEPERIAAVVSGIAEGCVRAGCALVGGETAEHPGLMDPDEFDLAATGVGVVEEDALLGPERVRTGDVVVAMASSGLHSNGYSLVRHVLLEREGLDFEATPDELAGRALGDELLEPTRIYALDCLALVAAGLGVRTFAHVTGGGLADNLARVLPVGVEAVLARASWRVPGIFRLVAERGRLATDEVERTLNMGVGMVAIIEPADADRAVALLASRGVPAWVLGEIRPGSAATAPGTATLLGSHPGD